MMEKLIIGTKYQTYDGDELKIHRLIRIKNTEIAVLEDVKTKEEVRVSHEDLKNKYVQLVPDAFMNIMLTKDSQGIEDVYLCINKSIDLSNGNNEPAIILRQNSYSFTKNSFMLGGNIYVGDCVSKMTLPPETTMEMIFEFDTIEESYSSALYIDDSIDDIIKTITYKMMKKINNMLESLAKQNTNELVFGYCNTLEELMQENNFMYQYRAIFNIMQIDFPIVLGDISFNKEGDIVLNNKQINLIENLLCKYISNVRVIEYDKDLDISEIVSYTHSMVCDTNNKIYLIAYTVDGYKDNGNNDVLNAMGINV